MKSIKLFSTLLILGVSLNIASAALPTFHKEVAVRVYILNVYGADGYKAEGNFSIE